MSTKLTLTVDREVIEKAKAYAKKNSQSLSEIIESYLRMLTETKKRKNKSSSLVNSLQGSFKAPEDFNYKEELQKELENKHLRK